MTNARLPETLILPVGQFFGTFYDTPGSTECEHSIRRGAQVIDLGGPEFTVWTLLHGIPERISTAELPQEELRETVAGWEKLAGEPWGRQSVRAALAVADQFPKTASGSGPGPSSGAAVGNLATDVDRILIELIRSGLAVELTPGEDSAVRFAQTHRIHSRMLGLGNTSERPWEYSIGLFDLPVIGVTRIIYNLWGWSFAYPSLWSACVGLAGQEREAGSTDDELTDPQRLLAAFCGTLHQLLSVNVVYLDPVT